MRLSRHASRLAFALLFLAGAAQAQDVRISQVYGGGGNSGATWKSDFIELFNAGAGSVSLSGWSVQYASSTGTSWQVTNLSGSIAPGQYLLVQQATGAGGTTNLPTPDVTGTIAMSGTAGKVVLRTATTAFTGTSCPTGADVEDLVTFGGSNCPNPVATLSNTTAGLRKTSGCTDTGNNTNDFSTGAPTPRNTASATNSCGGAPTPTNPAVTASLSPSAVQPGESFTVRATVVFGTNPASTGVDVVANLVAIGGSAAQTMYDDGAHDDGAAGDKIYGFVATVPPGTTTGAKILGVGVADAQARSGSTSATLDVVALLGIHDIQGNGSSSPYSGQKVAVEGIVTARKSNGFFLQTPDAAADADALTSEGIFVFTSAAPSATATVGNRIRVLGDVIEYVPGSNPHQLKLTEITNTPTLSLISSGNALPAAIVLTAALMQPGVAIDALERYEGMRVSAASLAVVAPVGGFITESSASSVADGVFYGVLPGVARPFREEGVGALDTTTFPGTVHPLVFDTNPERLRVQSTGQPGAIAVAVDVGDSVAGLVGVLDYGFGAYSLLPDPSAPIVVTPGASPSAVALAKKTEITIGGFNLLRFFDDVNAPGISDPVLTADALSKRLKKTANAICAYVRAPDILGVVEVENLSVLQRLADTINAGDTQDAGSCARNPNYVAYLQEGNDIGGIDVGFLLDGTEVAPGKLRVEVLEIVQLGKDTLFYNPDGSTSLLNDRPSLLLRARVNQANGASSELTIISNHLRSLSDVNSVDPGSSGWASDGARVRAKRAKQAEFLAGVIQARQSASPGERIVLLGDFNAFEFNDGYVDGMGVITGREAGPTEVLNYVDSPIVVPLTNMALLSPEADRYSFSYDGNAQSLDHMVVNQALLDSTAGVRAEHARINADFGEDNFGDFTVPVRVSDHDPVVLYLSENRFASADIAASLAPSPATVTVGQPATFGVGVANGGPDDAVLLSLELEIDVASRLLQVTPAPGWSCGTPQVLSASTKLRCTAPTLASGGNAGFVVSVPTSRELGGRSIMLSAKAGSAMTDLSLGNNSASAAVAVQAWADLAVFVKAPALAGPLTRPGIFVVSFANGGPHDARNAVLAFAVNGPRAVVMGVTGSLSCRHASSTPTLSTWTCPAGAWYGNGRGGALSVTVNPAYANGGSISVGAGFSSETSDPNPGNNAASAAVLVP